MSLSMPTTSNPRLAKNNAVSEPISPAAPLTIATDMSGRRLDQGMRVAENRQKHRPALSQPLEDIVEHLAERMLRRPTRRGRDLAVVADVVRHVGRVCFHAGLDGNLPAAALLAEGGQLPQRDAPLVPSADVEDA